MLVVIRSVGRPVFYGYDLPLRTQQARGNQECTPRRVRGRPTHFYVMPPPAEYKPCATATGAKARITAGANGSPHTPYRRTPPPVLSVVRGPPSAKKGWLE